MQFVTLTTDFGTSDYYEAMLKGAIYSKVQKVTLVDISHSISMHDILEAAFFVKNSYSHFPAQTIHVVAVQNYTYRGRPFIAFERNNHYFVGPNNGVFSLIFPDLLENEVYEISLADSHYYLSDSISHAVAYLSHHLPINEIGGKVSSLERKIGLQPVITSHQIRATIMHIDHFGNVIVNLDQTLFEKIRKGRNFEIFYKSKDPIKVISKHYNSVPIGDVVCIFNAGQNMEIAVNMGNAHKLLSLRKNETIQIDFLD